VITFAFNKPSLSLLNILGMLLTDPLNPSEISPSRERGKFVTMNHVGFIAGLATGLWSVSSLVEGYYSLLTGGY
jgi:hypothetical protein